MDCSTLGFPVLHHFPDLLKLMSIESLIPSNHPILCHPLLLLPSIFSSIRVCCNELILCIRWPKYWSFIRTSTEYVLNRFSRVPLFSTLWTVACQAPLSLGFSRQEYWSGLPCPLPGDLLDPGIEPGSPALAGRFFYH